MLAYGLLSLSGHAPFHPVRRLYYFDLRVYRGAAHLVLTGAPLYDRKILGFNFTYPPFAALALAPLAREPLPFDEVAFTVLNVAVLVAVIWLALRLPCRPEAPQARAGAGGPARAGAARPSPWLVVLLAGGALWLEPVTTTIAYGQIDLIVAVLVVFDLSRRDSARTKGAAIGLAAGLKLTPLIFIPYLLLCGRRRAAAVALASFTATVAAGTALLPGDTARYWSGVFLDSSRVGGRPGAGAGPADQSLRGALMRLEPSLGAHGLWLLIAGALVLGGLALAAAVSRRGDEGLGFALCALTALLASPISWTHHWVLAVPALVTLGMNPQRRHTKVALGASAAAVAIGCCYSTWLVDRTDPTGAHLGLGGLLAADPYVLAGLALLGVVAATQWRGRARTRPPRTQPLRSSGVHARIALHNRV